MNTSGENNRSVRFTKIRIKNAYFTLMRDTSLHKISVSQIVKLADISRATFYLHYSDAYDLLNKTEDEIIASVLKEIMSFDASTYVAGEYPIARRVFDVFSSHSEEIDLLCGNNGDPAFPQKFQDSMTDYFCKLLSPVISHKENLHPVLSFLIGGVLNMFLSNLKSNEPVSNETLAMISNRYLRATNILLGLEEN